MTFFNQCSQTGSHGTERSFARILALVSEDVGGFYIIVKRPRITDWSLLRLFNCIQNKLLQNLLLSFLDDNLELFTSQIVWVNLLLFNFCFLSLRELSVCVRSLKFLHELSLCRFASE